MTIRNIPLEDVPYFAHAIRIANCTNTIWLSIYLAQGVKLYPGINWGLMVSQRLFEITPKHQLN